MVDQDADTDVSRSAVDAVISEAKDEVVKGAEGLLEDFVNEKGAKLAEDFKGMLAGLSGPQKEYVGYVAYLKAMPVEELSLKEKVELGGVLNKASSLNLELTGAVSTFWATVQSIVGEAALKFAGIAAKVAIKMLLAYIGLPLPV